MTAQASVQVWCPQAQALKGVDGYVIYEQMSGTVLSSPNDEEYDTAELAWEAALQQITQVSAYYIWQKEGSPLFNPYQDLANWTAASIVVGS